MLSVWCIISGLLQCIEPFALEFFEDKIMQRRPLFDQMIVNVYEPGEVCCSTE